MYRFYWEPWLVIGIIGFVYCSAAFYFYRQRNKVSFLTRSPLTVAMSLIFLATDSVVNTFIFSEINLGNIFHWQCNMGIVGTIFGQFGFMLATGMRIFRINKVYHHYLSYLEIQKVELSRPSEQQQQVLSMEPHFKKSMASRNTSRTESAR